MIKRLLILQILIAGGLGAIFLMPKTPPMQSSAVSLEIPNLLILSGWAAGPKIEPSEKELSALAKDTEFSRRNFYRSAGMDAPAGSREMLQASIVLSGKDINNSIHRPERCLPAQGFTLEASSELPVKLRDGRTLTLTKLRCTGNDASGKRPYTHLNYYWFVGSDSIRHTHYGRTLADMKDRLLGGYDQRWAYVTVSTNLVRARMQDESGQEFTSVPLSEEETDRSVAEFVSELAPEIMDLNAVKSIE